MTKAKTPKRVSSTATPAARAPHFDNSGHLNPGQAERLLAISAQPHPAVDSRAFVSGSRSKDDLAEELGEEAVIAMTTGEPQLADDLNQDVDEDLGGPFVITTGKTEFASGTDESNIAEATREPFPRT